MVCTKSLSSMKLADWGRENECKCVQLAQDLHRTLVFYPSTAAESGGLCMLWSQCHSRPPGGETCTRGVPQCFREGEGGLCHCEEALNGNSWHQRSQLTTRTITYWTKKPMEKQHRILCDRILSNWPNSCLRIRWNTLGLFYNYYYYSCCWCYCSPRCQFFGTECQFFYIISKKK